MTTHDECSQDLLFLTIFGLGEMFHCVRSVISSEDFILFRMKKGLSFPSYGHFIVPEVYSSFFVVIIYFSQLYSDFSPCLFILLDL